MSNESVFGEVISTYTRDEAINDGVLIDLPINALAQEYGFRYHCAMTCGLFSAIDPNAQEKRLGQSLEGRLWDLLTIFMLEIRKTESTNVIDFKFLVQRGVSESDMQEQPVKAVCGPGDNAEPVITFMLPDED